MASQSNQQTFAEKAGLWLKVQKQQQQQQQRQQHPVEQQHYEQLHQKPQQQQLALCDPMKVMTFAEKAELWFKTQQSQLQRKHDQQYSQEQQQKQQLQQKKIQTPESIRQGPIQTPGLIGQGPIQTPDPTGQGPIQTLDPTKQGPIQTPGLTEQGPIQTPGLTGQGLISVNKVSLSQTPDAHGQGRLSAHVTPGQAYSKDHFQQHPQQHTGETERQPTDSLHDLPQSSLDPDVMSIAPSVPYLQKKTRLTKTSSTIFAYNAAEAPVRQDINDGSHPEINAQQGTQDLSAVENGARKKGQAHCFEKKKEQTVSFIHNPRLGQIIKLDVSEMKKYCCWNDIIGSGAYGTVYKAKIDTKDNIGKYVIKEIKVADFDFRMKSFEREIRHGRILHPHIIPIIAWAEDILEKKGAVYLMYPCMENGSVRKKIEDENKAELFCEDYRTNSMIWLRCFYQVSQALDYLHKPGKNNSRAEKLKVAQWPNDSLRDHLAKQAWGVIESDAKGGKAEVTAADFFKDYRLETWKRYRQPKDPNRCGLCYINPTAKNFPLMGEECKKYSPPCTMYCIYCLSDHHNHLVCPLHGPSRPPFGDHVYGVFVAGNHVKHFQGKKNMTGKMSVADIAEIFTSDANKVASILKFPLVLGIRKEHLEVVTPKEPGREGEMIDSIKEAFEKINIFIRKVLTENKKKLDEENKKNLNEENKKNLDEDRLINSLFIFYFTGHGSKKDGLYLGSETETINASTQWLKEMLCETLRVDQVLVILDCCHAAEQNFARMKGESKIGILQLSSCDKDEKSICMKEDIKGSLFTHFLVQALQGDNFVKFGDYFRKLCKRCKKEKKKNPHKRSPCEDFHLSCSDRQSMTLNSVEDYIREHYKLHEVELNLKEHCDDTDVIHLGYYKPEMSSISICLEDAQNGDKYHMVSHPESMPRLKLCIVRYIEEKKLQCRIQDILEFYRKLPVHESQTSSVEKTSSLISIQPVSEREAKELICLEDLYKIIPCGRAVEAKIRDNLEELKLGSNVILGSLKRSMTRSLEQDFEGDGLKIRKEYIHVEVNLIRNVIRTIIQLQGSDSAGFFSQEFKDLLKELQDILKKVLDNVVGTVLKIQLYDEFSVVEIT